MNRFGRMVSGIVTNLTDYLEAAAARSPDKLALSDERQSVSFAELRIQARSLGTYIAKHAGGTRRPVAVITNHRASDVIAFMAVLYAGCFYVPVSPTIPESRRMSMLNTMNPELIVSDDTFNDPDLALCDDVILGAIAAQHTDTSPAYAMFTSGTTGAPKAVLISHRSVIDVVAAFEAVFPLSGECIFANQAPFDFDVSVKDIFLTLSLGATMHIVQKKLFSAPAQLISYLREHKINTLIWSTSALRMLASFRALDADVPDDLRLIMFSGEVMPNKVLNYWRSRLPDAQFVNLYGPTEITCNCTYYIVDRAFDDAEPLPIGTAFPNTAILLLSDTGEPAEAGARGEICVRGAGLALGYYNNAEATAAGFIQNPTGTGFPERVYKTGDIGAYNTLGELMFFGRNDHQIKHMGHRIELSEIELAVNALPFIDFGCCMYDEKGEKILLFYQAAEPRDREIAISLRQTLPDYMLPRKMIWSETLPLNKNGKIDRVALTDAYFKE